LKLPGGELLTYCTNIHPGESWSKIRNNLDLFIAPIKQSVAGHNTPFGIGLRLSAVAAQELVKPEILAEFKGWLATNNCFVFTINGFPYGDFHGTRIKENVYLPDWRSKARLKYTLNLANILSDLLPPKAETYGSISTVPIGFQEHISSKEDHRRIIENILSIIISLINLKNTTGKEIILALEPEPYCYLSTVSQTISFLNKFIFSKSAIASISNVLGIDNSQAESKARSHIGICFDLCHAAVEFEEPEQVIQEIRESKILIPKIQISNSLEIREVNDKTIRRLLEFDDGTYLHQVVEKTGQQINRYKDISDAVSNYRARSHINIGENCEWRIHFHIPIFHNTIAEFDSSQSFIHQVLVRHAMQPLTQHLEVETYTWNVLPKQFRDEHVTQLITRELIWTKELLASL